MQKTLISGRDGGGDGGSGLYKGSRWDRNLNKSLNIFAFAFRIVLFFLQDIMESAAVGSIGHQ